LGSLASASSISECAYGTHALLAGADMNKLESMVPSALLKDIDWNASHARSGDSYLILWGEIEIAGKN
jgi:hypothetical protein